MKSEEYATWAKMLNPIDDDLFKKMAEDKDFCQEIIRVILNKPDIQVLELKHQDSIKNLQGRSVVLDARCVDALDNHFAVEVQKSDNDDHQRRVRYNASCVTANITAPGSNFKNVPNLCSIYISKRDFSKVVKPYTISTGSSGKPVKSQIMDSQKSTSIPTSKMVPRHHNL